jgi:hypothetical protein
MEAVDKIAAFAADAALPAANGGGRNPGKKALITKAKLVPLSQAMKSAEKSAEKAEKSAEKTAEKKTPADTTQH